MAARRSYRDSCGIARALDLVGERWALLVVRELVLGPKRFSDLQAGLPRLSPDVLAQRLRELEEAGVVERRTLPPPAGSRVYDLTTWGPNTEATNPDMGNTLKTKYYWGSGDKPPLNDTWIKNEQLNALLDKQFGEFDKTARQAILTQIEDLLNTEMPHIPSIVGNQNYFVDPSLKNSQMPRDAFNGGFPWFKYWWFDKG